jgi:hypothetical protein
MVVSATLRGVRKYSTATMWRNGKQKYAIFNSWSPLHPTYEIKLLKGGKWHAYPQKYLCKTKDQTSLGKLSTVILTQKLGETVHFRLVVAKEFRLCVINVHNCQILSANNTLKSYIQLAWFSEITNGFVSSSTSLFWLIIKYKARRFTNRKKTVWPLTELKTSFLV